jgi:hypothetical protein
MLYCTAFYYQYRILRKEQLNFDEEKSGVVLQYEYPYFAL